LFYADGQTDRQTDITKLTGTFRNFAKEPENRQMDVKKNRTNIHIAIGYYI